MSFDMEGISKLLLEMKSLSEKAKLKLEKEKRGYESKCKTCNSEYLNEIEQLREDGLTYQEIIEELNLDLSIMSLSRHFKQHYPKNQEYKYKQKIQMLENIQQAYKKYPFLEDIFKDKDIEFIEEFNNDCGFCTDSFDLCYYVKESTVSNSNDVIESFKSEMANEIKEDYSFYDTERKTSIYTKYHGYQIKCLNCKSEINENRLDLLEKIISYNFLNIPTENKELYYNLLEYDGNKENFIETLSQVKEKNQ